MYTIIVGDRDVNHVIRTNRALSPKIKIPNLDFFEVSTNGNKSKGKM